MSKRSFIIIASILLSLTVTGSSLAETQDQKKCDANVYWKEFGSLMYSFYDYDKTFDMFGDMGHKVTFFGNACWKQDLEEVERREIGLRHALRKAFYECNNDKIEKTKHDYYRVEVEKEFVRNIILKDEGNKNLRLRDKDQMLPILKKQFAEGFFKNWFTEESLEGTIDDFYLIYGERLNNSYNTSECTYPGWAELKKRWATLKENVKNLGGASKEIEQQQKKMSERSKRHELEQQARKSNQAKNGLLGKTADFIKNHFAVSLNGLKPLQGLKKIAEEFKENAPAPYSMTFSGLGQGLRDEALRYANEVNQAEIDTEYKVLYQDAGAEISASFVNLMKQTISVVNESSKKIEKLEDCADVPLKKMCAN